MAPSSMSIEFPVVTSASALPLAIGASPLHSERTYDSAFAVDFRYVLTLLYVSIVESLPKVAFKALSISMAESISA